MTQEDKNLLPKDLCARLPYGVIVKVEYYDASLKDAHIFEDIVLTIENINKLPVYWISAKPYLRPMSSMTDEDVKEIQKINWQFCKPENGLIECFVGDADDGYCSVSQMARIINYLNAHHFDYSGLIEKGLALEAPEEMYE